jgi:hypothetical protein
VTIRELTGRRRTIKASAQVRSRRPNRFHYVAYGLAIDSDVPLPELEATQDQSSSLLAGKLHVRLGRPPVSVREPRDWLLQTSLSDGQPWMWAARQEQGFLLRYVGLADFTVNLGGTEIVLAHAEPVSSRDTLGHLLLDQALPMVLGLRGIPTLHASTVVTPRGVCGFVGPAGAGKSTLAASFSSAGYPALGDDCLAIKEDDGFFAIPAYPGLRLWTDSGESLSTDWSSAPAVAHYTRKRRILNAPAVEGFPTRLEPLRVIYCLAREASGDGPSAAAPAIEPMRPNDAFLQLLSASFMLDITDRSVLTRNLRFIERLFAAVAMRRLRIPDGFSSLPKVREAVLKDLGVRDLGATRGAILGAPLGER